MNGYRKDNEDKMIKGNSGRLQSVSVYLEVLVFGHDGDLISIHTQDLPLEVYQLSLTHLHVVPCLEVVFTLLTYRDMHRCIEDRCLRGQVHRGQVFKGTGAYRSPPPPWLK